MGGRTVERIHDGDSLPCELVAEEAVSEPRPLPKQPLSVGHQIIWTSGAPGNV